ncbi:hypothetical protein [Maribellus sediminis]|uniref:hypothetical protein n=1 Tax=Maribellus sediminis TaxID=2696285 RepID=UPI0014312ED0|nr:hypothetical protein [Maribellus sediminis]
MKSLTISVFLFFLFGALYSQEQFEVPQLTQEQKTEVLYSHMVAYAATGISFAKSQGLSAKDYGKFIGQKFAAFWNPEDGFAMLVNRMMFILAGLHPENEMQIVEQDDSGITFKLKNVDLAFKNGPMFDVPYQDFLDCSEGIIAVIAKHMKSSFAHEMTTDGWYVVHLKNM